MKKLIYVLSLVLGVFMCKFVSGCSSDEEWSDSATNDSTRVEAMKTKVLHLAEKYGLNVSIRDEQEFSKKVMTHSLNLDSVEQEFKEVSQINGYYPFIAVKGNKLTLDTKKNQTLRRRRDLQSTRDVWEGSFREELEAFEKEYYMPVYINFNVNWVYDTISPNNTCVKIEGITASSSRYEASDAINLFYQFVGKIVSFNYNFTFILSSKDYHYTYFVMGEYSNGSSSASISSANRTSKNL